MVLHLLERSLRCNHCGRMKASRPVPNAATRICNRSAGERSGSRSSLAGNFPHARILRLDSDCGRDARYLARAPARADILVGDPDPRKATISSASRWWASSTPTAAFSPATTGRASGPLRSCSKCPGARTSKPARRSPRPDALSRPSPYQSLVSTTTRAFARSVLAEREERDFRLRVRGGAARESDTRCGRCAFLRSAIELAPPKRELHAVRSGPDGFGAAAEWSARRPTAVALGDRACGISVE